MNNVTLIGRLVRDVDLRITQNTAVANFTLAINRPATKDGKQEADFIRCVAFGKTAENCDKYLSKGKQAAVQGRIQTGSYEKDGRTIYTTDVIADRVEFLTPKNSKSKVDKDEIPDGFYEYDDEDGRIPF